MSIHERVRLRWLRLLLVLAALGAVAPGSARAAYAEVATASSAPVAAPVAVVRADRASAPDVAVHARPLRAHSVALPIAQALPVRRRYLLLQSLLL